MFNGKLLMASTMCRLPPRFLSSHTLVHRNAAHAVIARQLHAHAMSNSQIQLVDSSQKGAASSSSNSSSHIIQIFDKLGMPVVDSQKGPETLADLAALAPTSSLKEQLETFFRKRNWSSPTAIQTFAIPLILQHHDVLCVSPTASGKTFAYLFPSIVRVLLAELASKSSGGVSGENIERLVRDNVSAGMFCKYCEMDMNENKVCPATGTLHPTSVSQRDEDSSSVSRPLILILEPTSTLVLQVYSTCVALKDHWNVRYLVRASSSQEQKKSLQTLEGADILVTTPETIIPGLIKRKISLDKLKILIADEIDDIVSINHYDAFESILGSLPKGFRRPQRLLFGASLPPVAYELVRERVLHPTHRFVLAEVKKTSNREVPSREFLSRNHSVKHIIMILSQVEKVQKLLMLFKSGKILVDQRTIIFCNSRHNVAYVADRLKSVLPQLHVTTLSAKASTSAKVGTLKLFLTGVSTCLVCTDILSRGMDFQNVVYVVNYDMPLEMSTWVHRSGRCGRVGQTGYVYSFFQPENVKIAKPLVAYLREHKQLIPPKLREYARQSFLEVFKNSTFSHATRAYRKGDPQNFTPVAGRGTPRYPDYAQRRLSSHKRAR